MNRDVRQYIISYTITGTDKVGDAAVWATDVEKAIWNLRKIIQHDYVPSEPIRREGITIDEVTLD